MGKFNRSKNTTASKYYAIGTAISVISSALLILFFAFIVSAGDLTKSTVYPLSSVALGVSGLLGSEFCAKKIGSNGIVCGLIIGIILYFIFFIIGILTNGLHLSSLWLIRLMIVMIMSIIGGILGVNKTAKKSLVK